MEHGVDRIDIMGGDAVVIGTDAWDEEADLFFTTVKLSGEGAPALADSYLNAGAEQAESRSHAFFFRPDPRQPEDPEMGTSGVLGLPIARPGRGPFMELYENSAALIFLRRANGQFTRLGEIPARPETVTRGDDCVASCYDWYGNARPIFLGERIFALLGYELAEARVEEGAIEEIARVSFAPGTEGAQQASVP